MLSRAITLPALDLLLVAVAWLLAFWFRFNLDIPPEFERLMVLSLPCALLAYGASLAAFRVYRQIWRYTSIVDLNRLVAGSVLGAVATAAVGKSVV